MALVDEQGRLFGRFNVVDAVVGVFALGLIPLIYGSVVLFRTPPPEVLAVEPAQLSAGPGERVKIRGRNLRPYMRVSFGNIQGQDFLFKSTTEAEINVSEMPPGVYDVVLYDFAQERSRIPQALTVLPSPVPATKVILVGTFSNLTAQQAKSLTAGMPVSGLGVIREVREPQPASMRVIAGPVVELPRDGAVKLPATVEAFCDVRIQPTTPYCQIGPLVLQQTAVVVGETPEGKIAFQIDQVRGAAPLETLSVTARFSGLSSVIDAIRTGDEDRGLFMNPLAAGAKVTSVQRRPPEGEVAQVDVVLELQAERNSNGWQYAGQPLRAGINVLLRTSRYEMPGLVTRISPEWTPAKP